jgi:FMN-dependent oxidoreductase (nitrilotriacetate monooxygenase family)
MHLNVFTQCSPSPQLAGLWRHPLDRTSTGYRSLEYWTSIAKRLESACIDALFFADSHGPFDVYKASWAPAVRDAVQIPSIDPILVLAAAAAFTRHLGFAVTYSTSYHPPYQCARVFSSLDHLTCGRVAWNIVTSFLSSAYENGLGDKMGHDERYDRADEYMAVVRALWEESWETDAVRDRKRNVFADPEKVHAISHQGEYFRVRGPHQYEHSPQRTPVLYQAGASDRGMDFAARHAEVVFVTLPDPKSGARQVTELRERVTRLGRRPETMKVLQGSLVVLGRTSQEAKQRAHLINQLISSEGEFAKWSGWSGLDLDGYPDDAQVSEIPTQASQSVVRLLHQVNRNQNWTVADLRSFVSLGCRPHRRNALIGDPGEVATQMEEWMVIAGVDGFNLLPCPSSGIDDICDLLVPELQRRKLFRSSYDPAEYTLRERYFGAGNRSCRSFRRGAAPA